MTHSFSICLIEDDEIVGEALSDRFLLEGLRCDWFKDGGSAIAALRGQRYDAVVCDIQLPDISGETVFVTLKDMAIDLPPFIFTTAYGSIDRAVNLLKQGAHDFLTKPLDVRILLEKLDQLFEHGQPVAGPGLGLGVSLAMRHIESLLPRLAARSGSILITGESGVGKEEVAHAIHRLADPEGQQPFVAINCGALAETLLEAELFGYMKGAYTGASRDKKGCFELAHGGTLFLDEIGEMSSGMQVKLLRVLQNKEIMRVGGDVPINVDIRLICATHQDLKHMVEVGRFREDLYYRVHVVHVHVPPLRERRDDILWLARKFLATNEAAHHECCTLTPEAEWALLDYAWPGNVRELKHCLERACILHDATQMTPQMLFGHPEAQTDSPVAAAMMDNGGSLGDYLNQCERKYLENRLIANAWRIGETATSLGIGRKSLWEKMKKLAIEPPR
jgi:DNA-binding NtrC family response regulator